jgi:hypothetical protein
VIFSHAGYGARVCGENFGLILPGRRSSIEFPLESHRFDPLATYESNLTLLGGRTSTLLYLDAAQSVLSHTKVMLDTLSPTTPRLRSR